MISFKSFLLEKRLSSDRNVRNLKAYVEKIAKSEGIKIGTGRGEYHTRFPVKTDLGPYFGKLNLDVEPADISISDRYETYQLTANQNIGSIPKGTQLYYVNNYAGKSKRGKLLFNNKDLNPDNLGLAGMELNKEKIVDIVSQALENKYDDNVSSQLIQLMKLSDQKGKSITIPKEITFSSLDLAKVSADFGEILAAIWAHKNLGFREAYFPLLSNEKLIDFYGVRLGIQYPISVKSGKGGKVSIQNIIDAIKNRAKTADMTHDEEASLVVFNIVNSYSMKEQMLRLNQFMDTKPISELAKIMGVKKQDLTIENIKGFVEDKEPEELESILEPFWSASGTKLQKETIYGRDKMRLIIAPLGRHIVKILNSNKEIKESLNRVARQVSLIQINCDVKKRKIFFEKSAFKSASFEFDWADYNAGNKLGFLMTLNK